MDFETFSEAGYVWDPVSRKWHGPPGAGNGKRSRGLGAVGTTVYAQHPSTEVLTFSYRLPPLWWNPRTGQWTAGGVTRRWRPGLPNPQELFDYLAGGGILEAHKVFFERSIWRYVCTVKYGWPDLEPFQYQLRCSMAKARVNALPGALADLSEVLELPTPKDARGKALLDKLSVPRNPTVADERTRIAPMWCVPVPPGPQRPDENGPAYRKRVKAYERDLAEFQDTEGLASYCDTDLDAEQGASDRCYPLTMDELTFWWVDQEINWRGVAVDRPALRDCIAILHQVLEQYGEEYRQITGLNVTQLEATKGWLEAKGCSLPKMDEDAITERLERDDKARMHPAPGNIPLAPQVRRVLEIRQLTGSASVKKTFAMELQAAVDDRLRDLIQHHGARTGRPTGEGPQPLNMPRSGPHLLWCDQPTCHRPFRPDAKFCPWCAAPATEAVWSAREQKYKGKWCSEWTERPKALPKEAPAAVDCALEIIAHRHLPLVEAYFGNALLAISGCVRGLFVAGPGMDLIASDYSAIEAVVMAALAGEEWRLETFRKKIDIYLASAAKITGKTVEYYKEYADQQGHKHPDRQNIGKVAELALGFGGWIGAWRNFEDPRQEALSDDQVKRTILKWRAESPNIVEFWGGQFRGRPWDADFRPELYGVEGHAILALQNPGVVFDFRGLKFYCKDGHLVIRLLSGREMVYRHASLQPSTRKGAAAGELSILYWTWNSNPKYGAPGWVAMNTFGARLTENIVQATAHDILRFAIINLRAAGYPTVLHVYDEIVVEVPQGLGSIEEVERIMMVLPAWAAGWPIRAADGWRGRRYRKG